MKPLRYHPRDRAEAIRNTLDGLRAAIHNARSLFVLLDTALAMHVAQVARLGDAPAGPKPFKRRMNTAANTMGTLLVRSWDRAARLTDGLAARGIDGDLITLPRRMPASPRFLAAVGVLLGGIWLLTIGWTVLS